MEICGILNNWLNYTQDILLSNLKISFREAVKENKIYETFINFIKEKNGTEEQLQSDLSRQFEAYIKANICDIIPKQMKTGTSCDKQAEKESELLDLSMFNPLQMGELFKKSE